MNQAQKDGGPLPCVVRTRNIQENPIAQGRECPDGLRLQISAASDLSCGPSMYPHAQEGNALCHVPLAPDTNPGVLCASPWRSSMLSLP